VNSGSIVHLFPKPNVVIEDSRGGSAGAGGDSRDGLSHYSNSPSPNNRMNTTTNNDDNDNNNNNNNNNNNEGSPRAHVPQIILSNDELSRRGEILVLSSHEAYEAVHRVRLLSFLLLAYSTLQILRDVTIFLAPMDGSLNGNGGGDGGGEVIPPGDPTDTSVPSAYDGEDQLPSWENRDYAELAISALGVYVPFLGMKATTDHIAHVARRFLVLLGVLGVSWTAYTFYCHVIYNVALEEALGEDDKDVERLAVKVSFLETTLPFFMWVMFYIRALQFYSLIREAEVEANERARNLLPVTMSRSGVNDGPREGQGGANISNRNANSNYNSNDGIDGGDGNVGEEYDLELQREDRTIT